MSAILLAIGVFGSIVLFLVAVFARTPRGPSAPHYFDRGTEYRNDALRFRQRFLAGVEYQNCLRTWPTWPVAFMKEQAPEPVQNVLQLRKRRRAAR
jgi:hypothetical protein